MEVRLPSLLKPPSGHSYAPYVWDNFPGLGGIPVLPSFLYLQDAVTAGSLVCLCYSAFRKKLLKLLNADSI